MIPAQADAETTLDLAELGVEQADGPHPPETARLAASDLLSEAIFAVGARPGRLILTVLGTVLGIASVVVTIGLAQTMSAQVNKRFDAIVATQVVVQAPATTADVATSGDAPTSSVIPWDAEQRIMRLNGVKAAGTFAKADLGSTLVSSVLVNDPSAATQVPVDVLGTSPGALASVRGEIVTGRYFDSGHDDRGDRVAVLGADAAKQLGITRIDSQPSIFIGEVPYQVIGIIGSPKRRTDILDSVMIPINTARKNLGVTAPDEVEAYVRLGAGAQVGEQAPMQLDPIHPDDFQVQAPAQHDSMKNAVAGDINSVFLILGAVALIVGGIGIANITLLSVMERIGEIGLRRALGASKKAIAIQFIAESIMIGLLGGVTGAAIGVGTVIGTCAVKGWTPVLSLRLVAGSALLGGAIGLLAGIYPALRAATIQPISALRSGL